MPVKHIATQRPWDTIELETLHMPIDENGIKYILVIIDSCSRFIELFPMEEATGVNAANALLQLSGRFGLPNTIRHDGGSEFDNELLETLTATLRVHNHRTTPYRYEAHGMVERANRTIIKHLRALVQDFHKVTRWVPFLPIVQAIMNNAPNSTTGFRPVDIILGPCNHSFTPLINGDDSDTDETTLLEEGVEVPDYIKEFHRTQQLILNRAAAYYDAKYNNDKEQTKDTTTYKVGDLVLSTTQRYTKLRNKLSPVLFGPFRIVKVNLISNKYELLSLIEGTAHELHLSHLRLYDVPHVEPEAVAEIDTSDATVIAFLSHHGDTNDKGEHIRNKMHYLLLFDDGDAQWTAFSEAKKNDLYVPYLNCHRELHHLRTTAQAKDSTIADSSRETYTKDYNINNRASRSDRLRKDFVAASEANPARDGLSTARSLNI